MGLDMYLNKKTYVQNWEHMKKEELHKVTVKKNGKVRKDIKPERISYIEEQICYWRKANQIHKWFVDNCQDGEDDCRNAYVDPEQLQELLDICKQIEKDPSEAMRLLPPQSGFFFGSTDVDDYYMEDIKNTIKMLEEVLAEEGTGDFYYRSSW